MTADFQLQHKDPYLIFKQHHQGNTIIRGIWFPNPTERIQMNDKLTQVLTSLRLAPPSVVTSAPSLPPMSTSTSSLDHGAAMAALLSPLSLGNSTTTPSMMTTNPSATPSATPTPPHRQASPNSTLQQPTLDKKSLQLALLSLIQDERFLDLLHAQYLKVAHARANRNSNHPNNP